MDTGAGDGVLLCDLGESAQYGGHAEYHLESNSRKDKGVWITDGCTIIWNLMACETLKSSYGHQMFFQNCL